MEIAKAGSTVGECCLCVCTSGLEHSL